MMKFLTEEFAAGKMCHDSMALRHAGAFGNNLVHSLETPQKQMWEGACPRLQSVSHPIVG
ncbi:hypothetical protein PspCFBP13528_07935 [Pseudomonas sp. CFBP13528]|nr:hypothetical protein PspCFBP13528_07935 [Pseudomonas sp. CFBP13528]